MENGVSWKKCPTDKPVLLGNSTECTVCPSNTPYYNFTSRSCFSCGQDLLFSQEAGKCVQAIAKCESGKYYNYEAQKCLCPQEQPYEDANGVCIKCLLPKYFNKDTKRCESCPDGQILNVNTQKC